MTLKIIELALALAHQDFNLEIDIRLPAEGITAVYGPSGSGKTTLLRAISGLQKSQNGRVRFNGQVWQDNSEFLPTHRRQLAYVFQEPSLFEHLSVKGNIDYAFKRVAENRQAITPEHAIHALSLTGLLERDPHTLSGGEKQRVAIARAICSNPQLLLMDEPLSALDQSSKHDILPMILALQQSFKIPIIYVSHSIDEVARLADNLVLLEQGRVLAHGDVQTMLTKLDLSLSRDPNAESLINAEVVGHDDQFELTYLDSNLGRFSVLRRSLAIGEKVRILIAARDVSITCERQRGTSILNIFEAKVDQIEDAGAAQSIVRLTSNGTPILARVTKKSVVSMNLKFGDTVYLQAKSVAIL